MRNFVGDDNINVVHASEEVYTVCFYKKRVYIHFNKNLSNKFSKAFSGYQVFNKCESMWSDKESFLVKRKDVVM